jgi:hypothetical protein
LNCVMDGMNVSGRITTNLYVKITPRQRLQGH